jgi:hypothetical protein
VDERELREFCVALLDAADVILSGAPRTKAEDQQNDPRRQGSPSPRLTPYRLAIARAWSTPEYHAAIVEATQPAGTALARATLDVLLPALDSSSGWSAEELRSVIHLSDRRIAADPLRGGAIGFSVAMDRQPQVSPEPHATEPTRAAIDRALREAGLARRFRWHDTDDAYDGLVHTYRASFGSVAEWTELEAAWKGLKGVELYARRRDVRLEVQIDPSYAFLAVFPKPPEEFPSGASCDWRAVVSRHPAPAGHPARVILGLDQRSAPIAIELAGESSHLLVSGAPGGGKTMALKAILASLLHNQIVVPRSGAGWEISVIDSIKAELRTRFSGAAVTTASATDPDGVVETLRAFAQGMDERYATLDGGPFDPAVMPRRLLVIEELGDVQDLMDPGQRAEFTRLLTRIVNVGRGCGISVIAATQRPSAGGSGGAVVGPRIRSAMGRLTFFLNQASDYAIALDRPVRRLLPRVPGRGALIDGSGDIVILQALQISDEDIADVVARATRGHPSVDPSDPLDDAEPRRPTAAEIDRLEPLTALRLIFRMQHGTTGSLSVSVRGLMERVREEGFVAGRTERYTASLGILERLGILEAQWPGVPTSPRRITPGLTWEEATRIVERSTEVGPPGQ